MRVDESGSLDWEIRSRRLSSGKSDGTARENHPRFQRHGELVENVRRLLSSGNSGRNQS